MFLIIFILLMLILIIYLSILIFNNNNNNNKNSITSLIYYGNDIPLDKLFNNNNNSIKENFISKIDNNYNNNNINIGIAPIRIINLDKHKERLHHLLKQFEEEKLYCIKNNTCCNFILPEHLNNRFKYNKYTKRSLTPGEKKCFLSHELCLIEASKQKLPTLILEDDASLPFNFNIILERIINDLKYYINKVGVKAITIRLGRTVDKNTYIKQIDDTCLAESSFGSGAWAYIVTPEAASLLVKFTKNNYLYWPFDNFFNTPFNRQLSHNYDERIPNKDKYIFLDLNINSFNNLKFRYKLNNTDSTRNQVVQELSTELNISSSNSLN